MNGVDGEVSPLESRRILFFVEVELGVTTAVAPFAEEGP